MKFIKKGTFLVMALVLAASILLCSCGGGEGSDIPSEITYKVTVNDAFGNPVGAGTVVRFMKGNEQAALQTCNAGGVAEKALASGEYTVEVVSTDSSVTYHYDSVTLTAEASEATVSVSTVLSSEGSALFVSGEEYEAHSVATGCYYVELDAGKMNYYLFTPTEAGLYEFSVLDTDSVEIGYYGAPHFVQSQNVAEITDNSFTVSVSATMIGSGSGGTSVYVIGLNAGDSNGCILGIERIGDAERTVEDEPWTIYSGSHTPVEYDLPEGYEIGEFDLWAETDTYNIVFNEDDGFYHLDSADGPLVLVRLAEDCDYIACFETILDRSGVGKYFYDEDGNFVKKESYADCLLKYIACSDLEEGTYPLTEDLKYIITQHGSYTGWWNPDSPSYLFVDMNGQPLEGVNNELGWLLMCCYLK